MPQERAPLPVVPVDLESLPFRFSPRPMEDAYALTVCRNSFWQFMSWRDSNIVPRWNQNEKLWWGAVEQRLWEGTKIKRASVPVMKVFQTVDSVYSNISQDLFGANDLLRVVPEKGTPTEITVMVKDRLKHILSHNVDDYGWSAVMEYKQALLDCLLYGICYGIVEYDYARRQPTVIRLDPKDVYVDPACTSSYSDRSRHSIVRRLMTVSDVEAWRGNDKLRIPPVEILYWLAKNKVQYNRSNDVDNYVADPAGQFLNLFIHFFSGREVWTLDNQWVIYNEPQPYNCMRLVSAPCKIVPNRHYGMSLVDTIEGMQQAATTLLNQHLDGRSLALSPPRSAKTQVQAPGAYSWRPNALFQTNNPKEDMVIHKPEGLSTEVWQDLSFLNQEIMMTAGQNPLSIAGMPGASNANRTMGGVQTQLSSSNSRIAPIAENFEQFFMIPSFYKMLKVDAAHARGSGY